MTNYASPLYEMNFVVADEVLAEVDSWLHDKARASLQLDGIDSARVFESDIKGRSVRTCQFQALDDNALNELLDGYFSDIEAEAAEKFGSQVIIENRTLRADQSLELAPGESATCLNCGTHLRGQYCGHCGQRSRTRMISIWQLLQEAFGDLLELDSRLWRTVLPLLARPGQLTRDYLEGRRARYMPPFRTYLVLSVVFFVVAFFDPQDDLSLFFEPQPLPTAEEAAAVSSDDEDRVAALETLQQLEAEGKISKDVVEDFVAADNGENDTDFFGDCENASISDEEDAPEWVKKRFSDERVRQICERNQARGIDNFADAMLDHIPIALIVLLPLMALVLKILYPMSRRYFVEHLLFFVHFHAFFFLMLILQIIFARVAGLFGPEDSAIDSISTLILVVASFYIPVYLYKAMRHVYGQGHLVTLSKYVVLAIAYFTGAALTMLGAFLFALLSA